MNDADDDSASTAEFAVAASAEEDGAVLWAQLQLMELVRALNLAEEDASSSPTDAPSAAKTKDAPSSPTDAPSAAKRAAVLNLARLLEACRSRPLCAAVDAWPDEFGDAALRLWTAAAAALSAADESAAAQGELQPPSAPKSLAHRRLSARLRPKTLLDGPRLAEALSRLVAREPDLSFTLAPDGSALLSAAGELALRVACDRLANELKLGKEQGVDVGAVLAPARWENTHSSG